jgi:hypothetical protein
MQSAGRPNYEGSVIQSHSAPASLRLDRKVSDVSALVTELHSPK